MAGDDDARADAAAAARVRFVARPASVPAVRRMVTDAVAGWGRAELRDDAVLVATELATNAVLHGEGGFFEVSVAAAGPTVRVVVDDLGATPAAVIASRSRLAPDEDDEPDPGSMTGRGLQLVGALATRWGVEDLPAGTRAWAELADGRTDHTPHAPVGTPDLPPHPAPGRERAIGVIELRACPPHLLLEHDENLADIARELRLFGATYGDAETVAAAGRIAEVVRLSAISWDAARLVAQDAVRAGLPVVDIAIASGDPADVPRRVGVLRDAVRVAEALMSRGLLMTMPAPDAVQDWRDWVEDQMVGQVTAGRPPVAFADWLAAGPSPG